jgi:ferric-dicitrate binding protein FerR (iron transport regulator)
MAGLLAYWFTMRQTAPPPGKVLTLKSNRGMLAQDSGQVLTGTRVQLADGTLLDPAVMANGAIMKHGVLSLVKAPGGICFSSAADPGLADSAIFTTITTPAGGRFTVWLPDGTEVILNAASSLRFPVVFNARHRTVEASGELYFHVRQRNSPKGRIPFFVHTSGMNMEVLGTRFNVHVYPKEKLATATLEEGSLRVWKQVLHNHTVSNSKDRVDVILRPGQQALISNHTTGADMGGIRVEEVNLQEVLSWKMEQSMENKKTPCSRRAIDGSSGTRSEKQEGAKR